MLIFFNDDNVIFAGVGTEQACSPMTSEYKSCVAPYSFIDNGILWHILSLSTLCSCCDDNIALGYIAI